MLWTSVGHAALQTDSWHEGLCLSGGFFDNRLHAAICESVGHPLPAPRTALVSAPHTGIVITGACSSSLFGTPGSLGRSTSRVAWDSGLWALVSALPLTSNVTIDKASTNRCSSLWLCFLVGKGLGGAGLELTALTIQERVDSRD